MIKHKKIFLIFILLLFSFSLSSGVLATNAPIYDDVYKKKFDEMEKKLGLPGSDNIGDRPIDIVVKVIRYILSTTALIFLALIILSGFRWMTSAGNEESVSKAKKVISSALIGIVIIFLAYSITLFVFSLFVRDSWQNAWWW